jgi:class 3 adenylate cyclase
VVESTSRTLVCSVLFLDIAEYSRKPVAEQLQLKQAFNRILGEALEQVAPRDRIILDTGDGAAVTFMGDPEDALFAAMSMRDMCGTVPVRSGVNLGPVRLVKDLNSQMNIIGDGINVAQRVMSFSRPGQLLVSRSFYEVVSCLSRDYANLFHHEGSRTDKHVREHEVYSVVGGTPTARRVPETESKFSALANGSGLLAGHGPPWPAPHLARRRLGAVPRADRHRPRCARRDGSERRSTGRRGAQGGRCGAKSGERTGRTHTRTGIGTNAQGERDPLPQVRRSRPLQSPSGDTDRCC